MTTLHELVDPFDGVALDTAKWPDGATVLVFSDVLATATVGGGTLTYDFLASGALDSPRSVGISHNAGYASGSSGGLVGLGSRAVLEVIQYGSDPSTEAFFYTWRDDWWAWFSLRGTTLTTESGGNTVPELTPTFTIDPATMRFIAIDMAPSGLRFLASPNGVAWRVLSSRSDWLPSAGATFALELDAKQEALPAGATTFIFGGINTEPSAGAGAGAGTAQYEVLLYDTAGALKAVFDGPRNIDLELLLDGVSTHQISLDLNDTRIADFVADAGVVVRRKGSWEFATWDVIYDGLHRTDERQVSDVNAQIYTTYGRSLEDLLKRRYVQYFAETAHTDKTGPTETVMKSFVSENAGPLATTGNGRFRTVLTPIQVQADGAQGSTWAGARAHQNLLDVCQELAQFGSVDFDVVRTGAGPATFEFRTYYPRKGVDRRATGSNPNAFIFSPAMGNVITPIQSKTRTDEIATVTALGQGEGINRAFVVEDGSTIGDSPWNDIEFLLEASNEPDAEGLDAAALAKLNDNGPQDKLAFEVAQITGAMFGRDYNVGDWVTARFKTYSHDLKIVGATLSVADGKESIKLQCIDPDTRPPTTASFDPITALFAQLQNLSLEAQKISLQQTNPLPTVKAIQLIPYTSPDLPPLPPVGAPPVLYADSTGALHTVDSTGISSPIPTAADVAAAVAAALPAAIAADPALSAAAIEFIVGNGQDIVVADRYNVVDGLPYTLTITSIAAQSVQGDTGSIALTFETFTPGAAPTYTTLETLTITGADSGALLALTDAVAAGKGISVNVSGVATFTQLGVVLTGTKS